MRAASLTLAVLVACGGNNTGSGLDGGGDDDQDGGAADATPGAVSHTFPTGSLIIPMDLSYQATGMLQAYGLVYALLSQGVTVRWVIDPAKTYHPLDCDDAADPCAWDCAIEGSGVKCPYPTSSPDFVATSTWVYDDSGAATRGDAVGTHAYRGGPFVVDAADRTKALEIIDAWNDQATATRSVFHVVTVHETTADFTGIVARTLVSAPTIAVFADGNEGIATGYLRAAGIPMSNGSEFPSSCNNNCGPGTASPDLLTEEAIMGDLGTCDAPSTDHHNGALFDASGNPAYCQIMSMHWGVNDRERVECEGGCPATREQCTGQRFTYNGHEVVAEVREFLAHNVHFFAECQAVNAYENTSPNPDWPFLDDDGRDGHFLTTPGTPPACPCTDSDYECVTGACGGADCCLPRAATWGMLPGYEVAAQPATGSVQVLRPEIPYNQLDGVLGTTGGSEPAYNLSEYLGVTYKNNRQVTLLTGPNGPGDQDLWMTGYLDGCDDVIYRQEGSGPVPRRAGCEGKISYLGGHQYTTTVPVTSGSKTQGVRLFLNALFEAQCAGF